MGLNTNTDHVYSQTVCILYMYKAHTHGFLKIWGCGGWGVINKDTCYRQDWAFKCQRFKRWSQCQ